MSLAAGSKLGPYEILALIGAGGMGEVYRARDTKLERHVAIKILPPALAADSDRMTRFEREAKPWLRSIIPTSVRHSTVGPGYLVRER